VAAIAALEAPTRMRVLTENLVIEVFPSVWQGLIPRAVRVSYAADPSDR